MKTYSETTEWLYTQLPNYQRQGAKAYKPDLKKMEAFMGYLGYPEKQFKSIHIAGTNGKGSTSHMVASGLQQAGFKVGLYTSPHLLEFTERIRVNGNQIFSNFVIEFVDQHQQYFLSKQLSFFEITVGMALKYFAVQRVDYAVVEVGLGGRLDATNVISPICTAITNIGLDHTQFLGTSLALIAQEKAGIIKTHIPIIIGESQEETSKIFRHIATKRKAPIYFSASQIVPQLKLDLQGNYQKKNMRLAYSILKQILPDNLLVKSLGGFSKVRALTGLRGRWETMGHSPTIIADVTHNKEGFIEVLDQLKDQQYIQLHFVLGFVEGRKLEEILGLFPKDAHYYLCAPSLARAVPVQTLVQAANHNKLVTRKFETVKSAFAKAKQNAQPGDLIYVGGSTFVVAEIL